MNALFAQANEVAAILPRLRQIVRRKPTPVPRLWFYGEITGNVDIPGTTYRWLYSWRQVAWNANDWLWKPMMQGGVVTGSGNRVPVSPSPISIGINNEGGGTSALVEINSTLDGDPFALAAVNGCEHKNDVGDGVPGNPNGIIGPGVDIDDPAYADCELEPKPISSGVVVPIFTLHGELSLDQVTGNRSTVCYMFALGNAHGKVAP